MHRLTIYALLALILDQASKLYVLKGLDLASVGQIEVLPPFLNFHMAWNTGVNFGLFATNKWVLIALALAICVWVVLWVRRGMNVWGQVFAGLLIGGALGNVIDRIVYGAVVDFLNMSCCGITNRWSFNIADAAIFVGAFGLILFAKDNKTP